jgi:hypothetical protein
MISVVGLVVMLMGFFPAQPVQAAIIIDTNTVWSGSVPVDQDIYIANGVTLTLSPGTILEISASDSGNIGLYPDKVEIMVDGTLVADQTTFRASGGFWQGISILASGSASITDCTIRSAVIGIQSGTTNAVTISGNEIRYLRGKDGTLADPAGGTAFGIFVTDGAPVIEDNIIHDIEGGAGYGNVSQTAGGNGGSAVGILVNSGIPQISGNWIYQIVGGVGGNGGNGMDGTTGADGTLAAPDGEDGGDGTQGGNGGAGGLAWGIRLYGSSDGTIITSNTMDHISGGAAGAGGAGGSGGAAGNGADGSDGTSGSPGGSGGSGGDGASGGLGGTGGSAYGIHSASSALVITNNHIEIISGGMAGAGGDGGNGGAAGSGGQGGNATSFSGGQGGDGGSAGDGAAGGSGGLAGDAFGFASDQFGDFSQFSGNLITKINGGSAMAGGAGGSGADGGHGGDGGDGRSTFNGGNAGSGGAGGLASPGGRGGFSGLARAVWVFDPSEDPGAMVNNILARANAYSGGSGGPGGDGGNGGDGGVGGAGGISGGAPGEDGLGADGADGANGGDGGTSRTAHLALLDTVNLTVTNNTFYYPSAWSTGGIGGAQGAPGLGGSGLTSGDDGGPGAVGAAGSAGLAYGLEGLYGTLGVYNNIFFATNQGNSTGLRQGVGMAIVGDYNDVWNWGADYDGFSAGAHDLAVDPELMDPLNGDFLLQDSSPCIDAGNNSAAAVPGDDFDGRTRPYDGDGNSSAVVDLGAYEFYYENVGPLFTSSALTTARVDTLYSYDIAASDVNLSQGDVLTISATLKPDWLSLTDNGDGTAALFGTPTDADVGDHPVTLRVTDLDGAFDTQSFLISVMDDVITYLPLVVK